MKKQRVTTVAPNEHRGALDGKGNDGRQGKLRSPIRKQTREDRQRYMREYMRAYRRAHPGLSTPYVQKFRMTQRDLS